MTMTLSASRCCPTLVLPLLLLVTLATSTCRAFQVGHLEPHREFHKTYSSPMSSRNDVCSIQKTDTMLSMASTPQDDNDDNKFGFGQRIESIKCLVVGGLVGSLALAPVAALHDLVLLSVLAPVQTNGLAQWEFDNDAGSLQTALFAIVYRYCIRQDTNEQLNQGVIGAFCLTRTLSRIVVMPYCSAVVLNCGAPLGYLDWSMLGQLFVNGAESSAMFGATAVAMDYCMERGYISKFPG